MSKICCHYLLTASDTVSIRNITLQDQRNALYAEYHIQDQRNALYAEYHIRDQRNALYAEYPSTGSEKLYICDIIQRDLGAVLHHQQAAVGIQPADGSPDSLIGASLLPEIRQEIGDGNKGPLCQLLL